MRTTIAILLTFGLTLLLSVPLRLLAPAWDAAVAMPVLARVPAGDPVAVVVALALVRVLPGVVWGLVAGAAAMAAVTRMLPRTDLLLAANGAGAMVILHLLAFPMLFPTPAVYPRVVEAAAILLGFVAALLPLGSWGRKGRRALRIAWAVLVAAVMGGLAVVPYLMMVDGAR